jgi:hypothetical protein
LKGGTLGFRGRLERSTTCPPSCDSTAARRWLLLIYRIKAESSGRRTYVWRQLRQLGAVYLQQAAAVLPDRPELRDELDRLGQRIRAVGGEASLLETMSPGKTWEEELVARFSAPAHAPGVVSRSIVELSASRHGAEC